MKIQQTPGMFLESLTFQKGLLSEQFPLNINCTSFELSRH